MKKEYFPINKYCIVSNQTDCIKLLNEIMDLPQVPIHGPIHHFIVPAVMLTCYNNLYGNKEQLRQQLKVAAERAATVPGANCAFCGACGAGLGIGQFASIVTETSPYSTESWNKVIEISSTCCAEIGKHGGPRCCKRDSYLAILTGVHKIKELLNIDLPAQKSTCKYFPKNKECRSNKCLFFPKKS